MTGAAEGDDDSELWMPSIRFMSAIGTSLSRGEVWMDSPGAVRFSSRQEAPSGLNVGQLVGSSRFDGPHRSVVRPLRVVEVLDLLSRMSTGVGVLEPGVQVGGRIRRDTTSVGKSVVMDLSAELIVISIWVDAMAGRARVRDIALRG